MTRRKNRNGGNRQSRHSKQLKVKERAHQGTPKLNFASRIVLLAITGMLLITLFETARADVVKPKIRINGDVKVKVYEVEEQAQAYTRTPRGVVVFRGNQMYCTFNQLANNLSCKMLVIESQLKPINTKGL